MQPDLQSSSVEFPSGPIPLTSPLYIERPPVEQLAYAEIEKPGSLLRIKAPQCMGKSSLLNRVLAHASAHGCHIIQIDFREVDELSLESINSLLRWFSANASRQLQLKPDLDQYWDEEVGSKMSCSLYWQSYLLTSLDRPIVLALNNVDELFEYPRLAREFLSLLRSWYEKAKQAENWRKLRFVVVYSTDAYVPLDINQSPFNVGLPLKLPRFTLEQVKELARRYGLDWVDTEVGLFRLTALQELTGGHPYLVNLALYHFCRAELPPEELLNHAATEAGIFGDHLRRLLNVLQAEPNLEDAFKQIISADAAIKVEPALTYKLDGLGLILLDGDRVTPSCTLYQMYFKEKLFSYREVLLKLEHLGRSRFRFDQLVSSLVSPLTVPDPPGPQPIQPIQHTQPDELTQLANRHQFEVHLQAEWKRAIREQAPLSVILIDIDYFKVYNETYGQPAGDQCLQRIAANLRELVQRPADLVARYGGEEFILLLPQTDLNGAAFLAETIRLQVAALEIACNYSMVDGLPSSVLTVSAGVASTLPSAGSSINLLLTAVSQALYQSKRRGRNQVTSVEI
ncbi:MAG: AAA-like domain-containing protein [Elainella sp. C42_A2020_010]|nr:AAA-like domain-containing protein [Elainella sp. C42_A2020_010]